MATNKEIAALFDEVADLLEVEGANPFRVRAYRNAALTLLALGREASDLLAAGEDLTELPGVGRDLAQKIAEAARIGRLSVLDEIRGRTPETIRELLALPGLGPKRARALWNELGIKGLDDLERLLRAGRVRELRGFGAKTEARLLQEIERTRQRRERRLLAEAEPVVREVVAWLEADAACQSVTPAGSFRRRRETIGDLDLLVASERPLVAVARFTGFPGVAEVVAQGETRATVVLKDGLQVDLRVVEPRSFGAALHYFTGSKAHNIAVRTLGVKRRLKINEYGVFRGERWLAGRTEAEVYARVGLPYIEPELRENRGEIDAARAGRLPCLVELADLRGDLHVHTTDSDGTATLLEMAEAAQAMELEYLAITDHSRHAAYAHGLDAKRLAKQMRAIDRANQGFRRFTLLKGIEVDIGEDGRLDLDDALLGDLDLVVGAVHHALDLPRDRQTERLLRAMDHRRLHVLAHPTGRLLEERRPCEVDLERLIAGAKERGCWLELNSQPKRLDLDDVHVRQAKEHGVLVSIASDAHGPGQLGFLRHGIDQARRGWIERGDVVNTRSLAALRRLMRK